MKKITYKILIIASILAFTALVFFSIVKKDYGYDIKKQIHYDELPTIHSNIPAPTNETIDGVDYLKVNTPVGKFGGVFKSSSISDPKTFNPYNSNDTTSSELSEIMYDGLMQTNPVNGEVIPKLAKSFEVLKDNKTYIIHLRKGVKWSDGKEITSDDVYYTYNDIIFAGLGDGSTRDIMLIDGKLPKVEKIDKYTIKFTTPKPFAPFLRTLSASIVPKHIFEKASKKGNEYFLTFQGVTVKPESLVTSGAFKLSEYTPAQRLIYKRNPNYYLINKNNEKLPYLDKWVIIISGDVNNQTLKFESGEIDVLSVNPSLVTRYREIKKRGDFDLYNLGTNTSTTFLVFNLNNRKNKNGKYYVDPIKQKWFQDSNFRSAIDWAINRQDLILNIFSGLASPLHSAEALNSIFLNEKIAKGHPQNIEFAKELLKKSGFYYKNNTLYDKENNRVEFELLTNAGNTQREATGVSIKNDLNSLGIKVNFKAVDFNNLTNKLTNEVNFDSIIIALTSNINEPNSGYNVWTPFGALHLFNKRTKNDIKSTDKILPFEEELEKLFKKGATELDFKKRKVIYDKYQEIVAKENPLIYLYAQLNITAIRKKIKNIYPTKFYGLIHNMSEIYIEE